MLLLILLFCSLRLRSWRERESQWQKNWSTWPQRMTSWKRSWTAWLHSNSSIRWVMTSSSVIPHSQCGSSQVTSASSHVTLRLLCKLNCNWVFHGIDIPNWPSCSLWFKGISRQMEMLQEWRQGLENSWNVWGFETSECNVPVFRHWTSDTTPSSRCTARK